MRSLIRKNSLSKVRARDPATLSIYPSSRPMPGRLLSKRYNALIANKARYYKPRYAGKLFNDNGIITRIYTVSDICDLMEIKSRSVWNWRHRGILPEPFFTVQTSDNRVYAYWAYHQVQPLYVWWLAIKARGFNRISPKLWNEMKQPLKVSLTTAEKRFYKRYGVEFQDRYTREAGKYGVIPIDP